MAHFNFDYASTTNSINDTTTNSTINNNVDVQNLSNMEVPTRTTNNSSKSILLTDNNISTSIIPVIQNRRPCGTDYNSYFYNNTFIRNILEEQQKTSKELIEKFHHVTEHINSFIQMMNQLICHQTELNLHFTTLFDYMCKDNSKHQLFNFQQPQSYEHIYYTHNANNNNYNDVQRRLHSNNHNQQLNREEDRENGKLKKKNSNISIIYL